MINKEMVYNYLIRFLPVMDTNIARFKRDCQRAIDQGADQNATAMLQAFIADTSLDSERVRATWNAYNPDNKL